MRLHRRRPIERIDFDDAVLEVPSSLLTDAVRDDLRRRAEKIRADAQRYQTPQQYRREHGFDYDPLPDAPLPDNPAPLRVSSERADLPKELPQ